MFSFIPDKDIRAFTLGLKILSYSPYLTQNVKKRNPEKLHPSVFKHFCKLFFLNKLERAVDGAPSQIPMLKFLTSPALPSPTPVHDPGNRMKILFNMFSIFYLWEHT